MERKPDVSGETSLAEYCSIGRNNFICSALLLHERMPE
jgi:hypothetical protein